MPKGSSAWIKGPRLRKKQNAKPCDHCTQGQNLTAPQNTRGFALQAGSSCQRRFYGLCFPSACPIMVHEVPLPSSWILWFLVFHTLKALFNHINMWITASKLLPCGILTWASKSYTRSNSSKHRQYNTWHNRNLLFVSFSWVCAHMSVLLKLFPWPHTHTKGMLAAASLWPSISQNVWPGHIISKCTVGKGTRTTHILKTAPASCMLSKQPHYLGQCCLTPKVPPEHSFSFLCRKRVWCLWHPHLSKTTQMRYCSMWKG